MWDLLTHGTNRTSCVRRPNLNPRTTRAALRTTGVGWLVFGCDMRQGRQDLPQPGIKLMPPALGARSLNPWTPGEVRDPLFQRPFVAQSAVPMQASPLPARRATREEGSELNFPSPTAPPGLTPGRGRGQGHPLCHLPVLDCLRTGAPSVGAERGPLGGRSMSREMPKARLLLPG